MQPSTLTKADKERLLNNVSDLHDYIVDTVFNGNNILTDEEMDNIVSILMELIDAHTKKQ